MATRIARYVVPQMMYTAHSAAQIWAGVAWARGLAGVRVMAPTIRPSFSDCH